MADDIIPSGAGLVLPSGRLPKVKLEGKNHKLKIELVTKDTIPEVIVVYPDGFKKFHQAPDLLTLMGKINGTLAGRYGIDAYKIQGCPDNVEPGDIDIILEGE